MSKKRERSRITNPEPFLPLGSDAFSTGKKRSKSPKHHQMDDKLVPSAVSAKILKEARLQQKEVQREEDDDKNVTDHDTANKIVFPQIHGRKDDENYDDDDDVDNFEGFSETQSQFGQLNFEDDINEEDERLLEAFLSKDDRPVRTLADIIVNKIKEKDAQVSTGAKPMPKLDDSIVELYKGVGKLLNKYTSGKMPKAFKHVPSLQFWEEVLYLTEPDKWSPNAMYQATRIFASNMGVKKVERFYKFVLLPRVREDIRKNKRLHFALYQSLKKALYKPAAFNKGVLLTLCESRTCNLREAVIVGSIIEKVSIPPLHSSVALLKLAEMEYCGTTSYFIKLLIEKKYALPYRVLDALVAHFMKFYDESRVMPVIWHQSLLAFAQRYKNELRKGDKDDLSALVERQRHKLVTPEILRELNNSRNRGERESDPMSISTPLSVVNRTIQEDRFDIPDVPMEED
ncbi:bystin-like [Salvia splendens]|uniref:bystin-like n=1 Tax=Salvia splendens TaxID=180675 RepID=UPI001C278E63|nr:bystin-like [Salvia splendens]XP_042051110.1 bystin-like [Salvia splendens]